MGTPLYHTGESGALVSKEAIKTLCRFEELALPTEVIDLIFTFIRDRIDMACVSLVCHYWRAIMARQMWKTFITDFQPCDTQELSALLEPRSGILIHIRRLIVRKVPDDIFEKLEEFLSGLLEFMPRNSLREFICFSPLSPATFKDLIVWQSKLERFDAHIKPGLAEFHQCDWMLPHVSGIKSYRLLMNEKTLEQSLKINRVLFRGMSGLEQLRICYDYRGKSSQHSYADVSSAFTNNIHFPRLNALSLWGINMHLNSKLFLERFDMLKLRTLRLLDCIGSGTFLNGMSDWYAGNTGRLDTFHFSFPLIRFMPSQRFSNTSVERFVMTCPFLSYLRIEHWGSPVLNTGCITRHGNTLQELTLATYTWPLEPKPETPTYSAQDLETILQACEHLQTLSIDMPFRSVNLGSVRHARGFFALIRWDKNEVCALPEFENALSTIARHRNIHTLRMLNLPNIQYSSPVNPMSIWKSISDDDAMKCQALMGKFADEVFRFLANCNSTVQFIDINPLLLPPTPPKWDNNDHQWPLYAYTAHTTSLEGHTISWAKPCKLNFAIKMLR